MNKIDRASVNSHRVSAKDFPKSGFDLSYKSRRDFILGHLIPGGYQWIMPSDKFQGSNDSLYTFNDLSVPAIPQVRVSQHNFFMTLRSLDRSFERAMCPDELNGMSATWRTPKFSLKNLFKWCFEDSAFDNILSAVFPVTYVSGTTHHVHGITTNTILNNSVLTPLKTYFDSLIAGAADTYQSDIVAQWYEYANAILKTLAIRSNSGSNYYTQQEFVTDLSKIIHAFADLPFGRGSLLDSFGFMYLRSKDIESIASDLYSSYDGHQVSPSASIISGKIDPLLQCEYALRGYYAVWYEHYRDPYLEKRSTNLPDWHDFDGTSFLNEDDTIWNVICFMLPRLRSWNHDIFVGSMPDDISRHVYAPIMNVSANVPVLDESQNYEDAEQIYDPGLSPVSGETNTYVNQVSYRLQYLDPITGSTKVITCPVPKAVNDVLSDLDAATANVDTLALDLRDLRKSQMLERYLKRNFYFGDEYQERMLAHYGSVVSDNSIRRPHLMKSSISDANPRQEIANMTNDVTVAGTRTATIQDVAKGDSYEFFAEEFGLVINMQSFIPEAQYAGICPQNLLSQQTDFPLPEFAPNNDEFGRVLEIAFSAFALSNKNQYLQFGHYPYAHAWRSRVDEVHGSFLDDKVDMTFTRFFSGDDNEYPKLNASFIHCQPSLNCFRDTVRLSGQGYEVIDHHFYVERVLPTPVEDI